MEVEVRERRRRGKIGREKTRRKVVYGVSGVCVFECVCARGVCVWVHVVCVFMWCVCAMRSAEFSTSWLIFQPAEHLVSAILDPIPQSSRNEFALKFLLVTHKTTKTRG